MKSLSWLSVVPLSVVLAAPLAGCSVETANDAPIVAGSLVVDWTIDGTKDPDECDLSGSSNIDVVVTASDGTPAGEYQQSCRAFATTIDLAPDSYYADAVLLDSAGRERTTSVPISRFRIYGGDQLTVPIDFPASSFYAP